MLSRNLSTALVMTFVAFQTIPTSGAEMLVLESNVPEVRIGTRMPSDGMPTLQSGERVKVLLLKSNETKVFHGPDAVLRSRTTNHPYGGVRGPQIPDVTR